MSMLVNVILAVQMLTALGMIGLILIQHGKGADMGAAFGSGSSGSLFGASGSANFLSRTTAVLAAVFFVCTLALAYFGNARPVSSGSVLEGSAPVAAPAVETGPAAAIPGNAAPAPAAPAPAQGDAPGSAQIPAK
ncbi:preprotein translocase subunit SecG [Acidovorax sp. SRB_14]|uniref:preprotein translocase subunit SecG n=1 Tax=unclassified Acidovorax TaxID=2684926 RepID=UPI00145F9456|nr:MULTISPECIES: preprotein translocase subunit SecG [unclassified Acidovorax]NMM76776.1 preprotein translocase subunit SecG [Acidovorax sp. SRB_24]NMM82104.1 preprotein translocase subunit SecG [Acidovorax sp. SRB_14]NMM87793.1 preprotein translocase subunit SecG [Rhodococcus sp. SRB_17]